MALKRKRSLPGFSSPASDATSTASTDSTSGSLPFFYAQSKPIKPLYHKPTWSFPTYDDSAERYQSASDLNSRTRKRHRDDRPEDEDVYCEDIFLRLNFSVYTLTNFGCAVANTISRLFNAQRQHPGAEPMPSQEIAMARPEQVQRSTLHSFWRIPKPAPTTMTDTAMAIDQPTSLAPDSSMRCEDCDDPLRVDDAMDLDEDTVAYEKACIACKRCVCDRCAVLGKARICLGCASGHER